MTEPIFVDLNDSTARIDPQRAPTGYVHLTISTGQAFDDAGFITHRGQVVECWITANQADALADALKRGRITA